jgi:hypothetical protein
MDRTLERLKEELDMFSDDQPTITVSRKDLEMLVKAYEKLKEDK